MSGSAGRSVDAALDASASTCTHATLICRNLFVRKDNWEDIEAATVEVRLQAISAQDLEQAFQALKCNAGSEIGGPSERRNAGRAS